MSKPLDLTDRCPELDPRMMEVLEEQFPIRLPEPLTTEREDLYHAGQRSVLSWLRRVQQDKESRRSDDG